MYYLIQNNEVVGTTNLPIEPPSGMELVKSDLTARKQSVYYSGNSVKLIPPQPSPGYVWDSNSKSWVEAPSLLQNLPKTPNWDYFVSKLRGSELFARMYDSSEQTIKCCSAFNMLLTALTQTKNVEDLQFAIVKLREALKSSSKLQDFTIPEVIYLNELLAECNFNILLDPPTVTN